MLELRHTMYSCCIRTEGKCVRVLHVTFMLFRSYFETYFKNNAPELFRHINVIKMDIMTLWESALLSCVWRIQQNNFKGIPKMEVPVV